MRYHSDEYGEDYYLRGVETGKSLYSNYRWLPELTIPLAATLCDQLGVHEDDSVLDFGCARGYLVKALRLLHRDAVGFDISYWAVNSAPEEVRAYLCCSWESTLIGHRDWVFAKDVLEHIEEQYLKGVLERLRRYGTRLWAAIPLGDGDEYVVPSYELDPTHKTRRPLEWWRDMLTSAGWSVRDARYRMPHVKENWSMFEKGNGFFVCE